MRDIEKRWYEMYEDFKMIYPLLEKRVVSWIPGGRREILVKLDDGTRIAYDDFRQCVRNVGNLDDISQEAWRYHFSRKLEELMWENGMNQTELAKRLGISSVMVSRYMTRKSSPTVEVLLKLSSVFGTTVGELTQFHDFD